MNERKLGQDQKTLEVRVRELEEETKESVKVPVW